MDGVIWQKIEGKSLDGGTVLSAVDCCDAQITLEQNSLLGPYSITFGLYGFGFHTAIYSSRIEADKAFEDMQSDFRNLSIMVDQKGIKDDEYIKVVSDWFANFVDKY